MVLVYVPGADPSRVYYGTDTHASALFIGSALALSWPLRRLRALSRGRRPGPRRARPGRDGRAGLGDGPLRRDGPGALPGRTADRGPGGRRRGAGRGEPGPGQLGAGPVRAALDRGQVLRDLPVALAGHRAGRCRRSRSRSRRTGSGCPRRRSPSAWPPPPGGGWRNRSSATGSGPPSRLARVVIGSLAGAHRAPARVVPAVAVVAAAGRWRAPRATGCCTPTPRPGWPSRSARESRSASTTRPAAPRSPGARPAAPAPATSRRPRSATTAPPPRPVTAAPADAPAARPPAPPATPLATPARPRPPPRHPPQPGCPAPRSSRSATPSCSPRPSSSRPRSRGISIDAQVSRQVSAGLPIVQRLAAVGKAPPGRGVRARHQRHVHRPADAPAGPRGRPAPGAGAGEHV